MPNPILTEAIDRLCRSQALTAGETTAVLREVMEGRASEVQTAGLLIAFRTKGETVSEIAGMARAMRELAVKVEPVGDRGRSAAGTSREERSPNVAGGPQILRSRGPLRPGPRRRAAP